MKKTILMLSLSFFVMILFSCNSESENNDKKDTNNNAEVNKKDEIKETSFNVSGNCGMCKERIEKTAVNIDGVEKAEWNKETKVLTISHKPGIDIHAVHQAIADAGHDTEGHLAPDSVYENLPGCCKYRDNSNTH